jgi:DNA-binding transcriptional regulator PaaX
MEVEMLDNIGSVAGAIWHYLENNNETTITKLTREIGENERTILMGVGWLAREGKLDFEKRKQGTYITLKTQQLDAEVV